MDNWLLPGSLSSEEAKVNMVKSYPLEIYHLELRRFYSLTLLFLNQHLFIVENWFVKDYILRETRLPT